MKKYEGEILREFWDTEGTCFILTPKGEYDYKLVEGGKFTDPAMIDECTIEQMKTWDIIIECQK